jgi:hypothetical protein
MTTFLELFIFLTLQISLRQVGSPSYSSVIAGLYKLLTTSSSQHVISGGANYSFTKIGAEVRWRNSERTDK